jgi:dihydroorotase
MVEKITIRRPDDFHVHLRWDERLPIVLRHTAKHFARALVMPNTNPPILDAETALRYKEVILTLAQKQGYPDFEPLMTIALTPETTPAMIEAAKKAGIVAVKMLPRGGTTNSSFGLDYRTIEDLFTLDLIKVFSAMEQIGLVLSIHGEVTEPGCPSLQKERQFAMDLYQLTSRFPDLKIVIEHISTQEMINAIGLESARVAGTITAHHLFLTTEHVFGQPHNYCLPVAKELIDLISLTKLATLGSAKIFAGSDSAPHWQSAKENILPSKPAAGCFTAPALLALYAQIFDQKSKLDKLENFLSVYGAQFYGLPLNQGTITLVRQPWVVPQSIPVDESNPDKRIIPFMAGQTLQWQVQ